MVVVEVEGVPDVGRTGATAAGVREDVLVVGEGVDGVELRDEERDDITVEVCTVVSVSVEVATDVTAGRGEVEDELLVEEVDGGAVTVGFTMTVAVEETSQPTSTQA